MGTPLHSGNPAWPVGTEGRSRTSRGSRARARETAEYEHDVDAFAFVPQPRPFWPRRKRKKPAEVVPHIRHGRFPREIERMLEREKPELSEPDEAELERLLAKHADIAEGARADA